LPASVLRSGRRGNGVKVDLLAGSRPPARGAQIQGSSEVSWSGASVAPQADWPDGGGGQDVGLAHSAHGAFEMPVPENVCSKYILIFADIDANLVSHGATTAGRRSG